MLGTMTMVAHDVSLFHGLLEITHFPMGAAAVAANDVGNPNPNSVKSSTFRYFLKWRDYPASPEK